MAERSQEQVLELIKGFIIRQRGALPEAVELDTRLLDAGLIDSFGLVDLGEEISRALGIPLLTGNLLPEDFESPRTLWLRIEEISS